MEKKIEHFKFSILRDLCNGKEVDGFKLVGKVHTYSEYFIRFYDLVFEHSGTFWKVGDMSEGHDSGDDKLVLCTEVTPTLITKTVYV